MNSHKNNPAPRFETLSAQQLAQVAGGRRGYSTAAVQAWQLPQVALPDDLYPTPGEDQV